MRKVMRAGHRQGGGVRGCLSGVIGEINIVRSEFSECRRTHTLFEYPLGKPSEAKVLKELELVSLQNGSAVPKTTQTASAM